MFECSNAFVQFQGDICLRSDAERRKGGGGEEGGWGGWPSMDRAASGSMLSSGMLCRGMLSSVLWLVTLGHLKEKLSNMWMILQVLSLSCFLRCSRIRISS